MTSLSIASAIVAGLGVVVPVGARREEVADLADAQVGGRELAARGRLVLDLGEEGFACSYSLHLGQREGGGVADVGVGRLEEVAELLAGLRAVVRELVDGAGHAGLHDAGQRLVEQLGEAGRRPLRRCGRSGGSTAAMRALSSVRVLDDGDQRLRGARDVLQREQGAGGAEPHGHVRRNPRCSSMLGTARSPSRARSSEIFQASSIEAFSSLATSSFTRSATPGSCARRRPAATRAAITNERARQDRPVPINQHGASLFDGPDGGFADILGTQVSIGKLVGGDFMARKRSILLITTGGTFGMLPDARGFLRGVVEGRAGDQARSRGSRSRAFRAGFFVDGAGALGGARAPDRAPDGRVRRLRRDPRNGHDGVYGVGAFVSAREPAEARDPHRRAAAAARDQDRRAREPHRRRRGRDARTCPKSRSASAAWSCAGIARASGASPTRARSSRRTIPLARRSRREARAPRGAHAQADRADSASATELDPRVLHLRLAPGLVGSSLEGPRPRVGPRRRARGVRRRQHPAARRARGLPARGAREARHPGRDRVRAPSTAPVDLALYEGGRRAAREGRDLGAAT